MIFDADDKDGLSGVGVSPAQAQIVDPAVWAQESADLAKQFAYAPPVSMRRNPPFLTREYETDAKNVARARAALAGARLANLIETALK
ncbi:S1/P1 nuclease [Bradyrhizobium sp. 33ap4]|uniref:S1/P1 nuclease n=1 Tax=Bradyrhizobium sp. 33ap4 TaxID=3061630 RepID=UPI00292DF645|nr:S1/P1 nuclease [Bradyrhizobium sp. 33ap4]